MKRGHFLMTAAVSLRRVGVLLPWNESDSREQELGATFRHELAAKGWIDGKNLALEVRWAGDNI
jgi:hypothetical protein